jgi:hypothetical protein
MRFILIFVLASFSLFAQSKIILINEKVIKARIMGFDKEYLNYKVAGTEEGTYNRVLWEYIKEITHEDTIYTKENLSVLKLKFVQNDKLVESVTQHTKNEQDKKKSSSIRALDRRLIKSIREKVILLNDSAYADFMRGVEDATKNYNASSVAGNIAIETIFLGVPVGLITSVIVSDVAVPDEKLLVSDFQKFQNLNYRQGYKVAALKIKRKQVWGGFLGGGVVNVILVTLFILVI